MLWQTLYKTPFLQHIVLIFIAKILKFMEIVLLSVIYFKIFSLDYSCELCLITLKWMTIVKQNICPSLSWIHSFMIVLHFCFLTPSHRRTQGPLLSRCTWRALPESTSSSYVKICLLLFSHCSWRKLWLGSDLWCLPTYGGSRVPSAVPSWKRNWSRWQRWVLWMTTHNSFRNSFDLLISPIYRYFNDHCEAIKHDLCMTLAECWKDLLSKFHEHWKLSASIWQCATIRKKQ